jgi:hypothetical protein
MGHYQVRMPSRKEPPATDIEERLADRIALDDLEAIIREEIFAYVNASSLAIPRKEAGPFASRIARRAMGY